MGTLGKLSVFPEKSVQKKESHEMLKSFVSLKERQLNWTEIKEKIP